jgi:hypothetical protein
MKPDDFEKQLQRQPLRPVPTEWRAEILRSAQAASPHVSRLTPHAVAWWHEWLWPSPQAWAGLAAVWMILLGLNAMAPGGSGDVAKRSPSHSAETETTLAAQRRELARLLDNNFPEPAPAPKPPPGPRSEVATPSKV